MQDEEGETGTNCDGPNICRGQHKTPKGQHQMGRVVFFCRKSLVTCRVLGCRVALVIISIVKKRRRRRTSGASTTWFLQTERTAALRRTHFVTLQLREPETFFHTNVTLFVPNLPAGNVRQLIGRNKCFLLLRNVLALQRLEFCDSYQLL